MHYTGSSTGLAEFYSFKEIMQLVIPYKTVSAELPDS